MAIILIHNYEYKTMYIHQYIKSDSTTRPPIAAQMLEINLCELIRWWFFQNTILIKK